MAILAPGCVNAMRRRVVLRSTRRGLASTLVLATVAAMGSATAAGAAPAGRSYELVSPPDKNGGDIVPDSARTRAAGDGEAVGFISLSAFADPVGTSIASEFIAQRSTAAGPGSHGWSAHAINPSQVGIPFRALAAQFEPKYEGEFSPNLDTGVFYAFGAIDDNQAVHEVGNLYLRTNLRSPGAALSQLLSPCPLCEATDRPLPPLPAFSSLANLRRTMLAGMSPDGSHVVFETVHSLTVDSEQAQDRSCELLSDQPVIEALFCRVHVYDWDHGTLRLAGILPDGTPADVSVAGDGVGASHGLQNRTPHVVSDGTDGHTRVFFTQPTDATGQTSTELTDFARVSVNRAMSGNIFARIDGTATVQINESERSSPSDFAPAQFLDASADGSRVFFMTTQALTDDALLSGRKIYMYDMTAGNANNLTLLNPDIGLGSEAHGIIGASDDGRYVYMLVTGQLVSGEPSVPSPALHLWHDGEIDFIGYVPAGSGLNELQSTGVPYVFTPRQARVTPDGRHLLFSAIRGEGLTGYDHGTCVLNNLGVGCREFYLYSADSTELRCISCRPDGGTATTDAHVVTRTNNSGTGTSWHETNALSDDGRFAFFTTGEALVATDTNGRLDAYAYDAAIGRAELLSSGTSAADSWFMDAGADGHDAFFITREQLVGWDTDTAFDLYDARVGGGFPEPTRAPPGCSGVSCQAPPGLAPPATEGGSEVFRGGGDVVERPRARGRVRARRCRRGFVKKRVRGKRKCVKRKRVQRGNQARVGSNGS